MEKCNKCGKLRRNICEGCGNCPSCHDTMITMAAAEFIRNGLGMTLADNLSILANGGKITGEVGVKMLDEVFRIMREIVDKDIAGDFDDRADDLSVDDDVAAAAQEFLNSLKEEGHDG